MYKSVLPKLMGRENLEALEVEQAICDILSLQENSPISEYICISSFLTLLRSKGESPVEIAAMVRAMKRVCIPVRIGEDNNMLDIVGTGGDGADTFNISTASCILAAACGCKVAKCGNRASSSSCGSADVIESLGISLTQSAEQVAQSIQSCGIGFLFAPVFHPAAKAVAPIRKALGVRTSFNLLGPLLNSADASAVVIGVFEEPLLELLAGALQEIGQVRHGVVIHGCGLDEISPLGPSQVIELRRLDGGGGSGGSGAEYAVSRYTFDPLSVGIARCSLEDLRGGRSVAENADMLREVLLDGESGAGQGDPSMAARRDAVVLNAGFGCYVYGLSASISEGVALAKEILLSGKAATKLDEWVRVAPAQR